MCSSHSVYSNLSSFTCTTYTPNTCAHTLPYPLLALVFLSSAYHYLEIHIYNIYAYMIYI